MQSEYNVRLSKIESERQTLAETLAAAERRGREEKAKADDLQLQLKSAKAVAESSKQELQDYKNKASRILQVTCFVQIEVPNNFLITKLKKKKKLHN